MDEQPKRNKNNANHAAEQKQRHKSTAKNRALDAFDIDMATNPEEFQQQLAEFRRSKFEKYLTILGALTKEREAPKKEEAPKPARWVTTLADLRKRKPKETNGKKES